VAVVAAILMAGCGGQERQDENEPKGTFEVEVVDATFPQDQKLAKRSDLVIEVRNTGDRAVPNIGVTVDGFDERRDDPDLADPSRPVFVINGVPKEIGGFPESQEAAPAGCETAYGKAKARESGGGRPSGVFVGTISDEPPETRVADDGKTVIRGTR
jgi:hypothetical protein